MTERTYTADEVDAMIARAVAAYIGGLNTTPPTAQPAPVPLTARELELIDGMIEVQLDHAKRCDSIANRTMAEKQKGWDLERVALLKKLKEKNT